MRYLLVDGHSMIFAWPELRKLHGQRSSRAREELIKQLTEYQDASGVRVVVVFDGKGDATSAEANPGGIQVFYSAGKTTADAIIERLVAKYAQEHEMTVATSDLMEQQTVSTFGAFTVTAEGLRELLDDGRAEIAKELKKLRRR